MKTDLDKSNDELIGGLRELRYLVKDADASATGLRFAKNEAQFASISANNIIDTLREPLLVLDADLKILSANRSFYATFSVKPGETLGGYIYDLGNRQ